jgi:muramoyltetrapeptide carboxypeptidase
MKPAKLRRGDEVRVISPSNSLAVVSESVEKRAIQRLEKLGLKVSIAKHAREIDAFSSSSIELRIDDLHKAFRDQNVKAIFTTLGGYNCNQLLKHIDFELIKNNPKILCGYSDITVLTAAIYQKTGLMTYSGPHFSTFGMEYGLDYTIEYMTRCLFKQEEYTIPSADNWSDDTWYIDQDDRTFIANEGYHIIREGHTEGTIIGGNLCTLNLLQGTPYMPSLRHQILFLEDDAESSPETFDRDLQSLLHQSGGEEIQGLVIGKFQRDSGMTQTVLQQIIESKKELQNIPIIIEASFGHTSPIFTFPVGGRVMIHAEREKINIRIINH